MAIDDKDRDDVMERLLELGGDKKYLTFDDLNRELPDNVVSPDDMRPSLFPTTMKIRSTRTSSWICLPERWRKPTTLYVSTCVRWVSCHC